MMNQVAFQVGFYTTPVLLIVAAYFALRFTFGLYRKVTRN